MFKNKKAQGIPMETVIIAIIVLVVLVVIIAFFVGGSGSLIDSITGIFVSQKGDTIAYARQTCGQYCQQMTASYPDPTDSGVKTSQFCVHKFKLDFEGKGKAQTMKVDGKDVIQAFYCTSSQVNAGCSPYDCTGAKQPEAY